VYWLLGDHLGSTAMTVASSGIKVSELRYKAGGETRHESGTTPTTHRFTGQRLESSLGLYHMGARWYDPTLARWLSADTIVPDPALPQGLNRYSYVSNRPVSHTDPSGHMPCGQACPGDYTTWQIGFGEAYHGTWNTANQAQARAVAELAVHVGDVLLAMASNQHDIASTAARCSNGGCNWLDATAFFPLIPGAIGRLDDLPGIARLFSRGKTYLQSYETFYNITRNPDLYEVHHILPQEFSDILGQVGIDVHDPRLLREVSKFDTVTDTRAHQRLYTDVWSAWASELGHTPSAEQILDFARALEEQYYLEGTLFYRTGGLVDWDFFYALLEGGQ